MCGIAGKLYFDRERPVAPDLVGRMMDAIAHRGPDGSGMYVTGPVGLGHRRLSIIDLGTGAQPMCNEDGTVWIVFNGEIYNFQDLRRGLCQRQHRFKSGSDTEVILHLWEEQGPACVEQLQGMFAFAIWDANLRTLFLARDRVGIKPLYYCQSSNGLIFGSEIKALLVDPDVGRTICPEAVDRFFTFQYVPGRETLLRDIKKLEPAHYLLARDGEAVTRQYWDLRHEQDDRCDDLDRAAEALSGLLRSTVRSHMISDVPVGVLASGGMDSTAVLSYAVEQAAGPIQTFTIGFSGAGIVDERPFARLASEQYGTVHHDMTLSVEDFQASLPLYVWHMEEPICEPPAIALYHVARMARQYVKVLLSGEGGDEAFAGYPEYKNYLAFERAKQLVGPARPLMGLTIDLAGRLIASRRLRKYAALADRNLEDYYYSRAASPASYFPSHRASMYSDEFAAAVNGHVAADVTGTMFSRCAGQHPLNRMLYVDTKTWLPDDLLIKADKMTMATSVELRVPLLDHKVLEFAATLPPQFKVRRSSTKRVLRRAFKDRIPAAILTRHKAGFPLPYGGWLRRELREFVADTVLSNAALSRGYLRRSSIEAVLSDHSRHGEHSAEVFSLLIFELWNQQFVDRAPSVAASPH